MKKISILLLSVFLLCEFNSHAQKQTIINTLDTKIVNNPSLPMRASDLNAILKSILNYPVDTLWISGDTIRYKVAGVTRYVRFIGYMDSLNTAVKTYGVYNNPSWLNTLAYSKLTGAPTALPPEGTAGGDLSGSFPNPTVAQLNGQLPAYYLSRTNHTGAQGQLTVIGLPDSLINKVSRDGSYADPYWLTALSWAKITGTPTTKAGYNITDVPTYSDSTSWLAGRWLPNRSTDTASALQARIQTKEPLLGFTAIPNTRTVNGHLLNADVIVSATDLTTGTLPDAQLSSNVVILTAMQSLTNKTIGTGSTWNGNPIADSYISSATTWNAKENALGFTPENLANKGVANGYADLDALGKIPASRIDFGQTGQTFVVASQAAMLAVSGANVGALAIRTDENKNYRLIAQPASTLANWQVLLSPDAPVQSVNGFTGNVNLLTTHISEGSNYYWTAARSRAAQSLTTIGTSGAATHDNTTGVFNIPVYQAAGTYLTNFSFTNSTGITGTVTNPTTTPALSLSIDSAAITSFHVKVRSLFTAGAGINISNGTIASTITQYTDGLARAAISAGTGISYNNTTGVITNTITQYTDGLARAALSFTAGSGAYNSTTGGITIPTDNSQIGNSAAYITSAASYYVGTTLNALNRASAAQTLTGINIDGTAGSETLATVTGRGASTSTSVNFTTGITINRAGSTILLSGPYVRISNAGLTESFTWQYGDDSKLHLYNTSGTDFVSITHSTGAWNFQGNSLTAGAASFTTGDFSGNVGVGTTAAQTGGSNFAIGNGNNEQIQHFAAFGSNLNLTQHYNNVGLVYVVDEHRAASYSWKIGTTTALTIASNQAATFANSVTSSGGLWETNQLIQYASVGGSNVAWAWQLSDLVSGDMSLSSGTTATGGTLTRRMNITSAGATNFYGSVTASGSGTFTNVLTTTSSDGGGKILSFTGGVTTYNAMIAIQQNYANTLEITASSAVGTTTFNRNIAKFDLSNLSANFAGSVTGASFIKAGGTSAQFLKADGSVDESTYLTTSSASLYSGEYTPATGTDSTNCTFGSNGTLTYSRNGNAVIISGSFKIDPAGAGDFFYAIGLPAGWTISSTTTGGGAANTGTSTAANVILKPYSSTKIGINGYATSTGIRTFFFTAQFTLTGL